MNKEEIKSKIVEAIEAIKVQIEKYEELTKPIAPSEAIGRVSRMDAINNKSVNEASLRQAKVKLQGLQRALGNIDSPDFGICLKCKQQIPVQRIFIRPESVLCVNCAS